MVLKGFRTVTLMVTGFFLWIFVSCSVASAHYLWINVSDYHPKVGEPIEVEIGWGHRFPVDETIDKEKFLKRIYVVGPDGSTLPLKPTSGIRFEVTKENVKKPGSYLVVAEVKEGFVTKTTDGYRLQSKKGLENAINCFRYDKRTKAVVNVEKGGKQFSRVMGHPLEIIPLKSPDKLKEGDDLPVKVLFKNEPLEGAYLDATYAGFSEEKGIFAHRSQTDKKGIGKITILKPGIWFVKADHKIPYSNPDECDDYSYCATLTFEVK